MTLKIAALASGTGTNVAAIIKNIESGRLDASIVGVFSNRPGAQVLDRAREKNIPVWAEDHRAFPSREAFDEALLRAVKATDADTVVLAGFMRVLSPNFVRAFPGRVLNIHPAILPSFPGAHGAADALVHGVRISGTTVHFVNEALDNGPIIIQAAVPASCFDSEDILMSRIHALEYRIYPQALQWLAEERLSVEGRQVTLLPPKKPLPALASTGEGPHGPWMISPALEGF